MTLTRCSFPHFSRAIARPTLALLGLALSFGLHALDPISAFTKAARSNDLSFIDQIAQSGLGEATRDSLRNNLLMIAIQEGGDAFAEALLKQRVWQSRVVLEQENLLGETPLMLSALKGLERTTKRLIELGAQPNRPGWTALHYAAMSGNTKLIRLLVDKGVPLDAVSPNGATPLMMAARFDQLDAAKLLLELGADPTLKNDVDMRARDFAIGNENKDLEFWIELGEVTYMSKFLSGTLKVDPNVWPTDSAAKTGSVSRKQSPMSANKAPLQPVEDKPEGVVEVIKGIQ